MAMAFLNPTFKTKASDPVPNDQGSKSESPIPAWKPPHYPDGKHLPYDPENFPYDPNDPDAVKAFIDASEVFKNSPEIARFDGIVCRLFNEDYDPPIIYVWVEDMYYCVSIYDWVPIPEPYNPSDAVAKKIQQWLDTRVPGTGRAVVQLAFDQWLHIRNRQPVEHVPTPDEIEAMGRRKNPPKRSSTHNSYYAIERIEILPHYHLKVWFENGDVKIVDIKAMRGDSSPFDSIWEDFDKVEARVYDVAWPVMFPDGPNTVEIEDQDLWGAGVDVRNQEPTT